MTPTSSRVPGAVIHLMPRIGGMIRPDPPASRACCAPRRNLRARPAWAWEPPRGRHMIIPILRREAARARTRQRSSYPTQPTVRLLLQDIAEGIRVLQTRDGVEVSEEQIQERARNIVTGLLGN